MLYVHVYFSDAQCALCTKHFTHPNVQVLGLPKRGARDYCPACQPQWLLDWAYTSSTTMDSVAHGKSHVLSWLCA